MHLVDELLKSRKPRDVPDIMAQVTELLDAHQQRRKSILGALERPGAVAVHAFDLALLDQDRIFSIDQIRKVCIAYRLRFLESGRFKSGFPEEALSKIRALEDAHRIQLQGFMIMAPTNAFRLDNYDDPLLFAPISDRYFYLVHQWGNDMSPWRKYKVWPVRNLGWFTAFCVLWSAVLTMCVPVNPLGEKIDLARVIVFLFLFKSLFAVAMYVFFMRGRSFSNTMWNSRFYNQ